MEDYDGQPKICPINMVLLAMEDITGVAANGGWHKICHAIIPCWKFESTSEGVY